MVYEGNYPAGSAKDKVNVGTERTKRIYKNHVQDSKFRQNRYVSVYPTNLTIKEGRDQSFAIETEYRPKQYIRKSKSNAEPSILRRLLSFEKLYLTKEKDKKENNYDESFILTHPAKLNIEEGKKEVVFSIEAEHIPRKNENDNGKNMMMKLQRVLSFEKVFETKMENEKECIDDEINQNNSNSIMRKLRRVLSSENILGTNIKMKKDELVNKSDLSRQSSRAPLQLGSKQDSTNKYLYEKSKVVTNTHCVRFAENSNGANYLESTDELPSPDLLCRFNRQNSTGVDVNSGSKETHSVEYDINTNLEFKPKKPKRSINESIEVEHISFTLQKYKINSNSTFKCKKSNPEKQKNKINSKDNLSCKKFNPEEQKNKINSKANFCCAESYPEKPFFQRMMTNIFSKQ